VLKKLLFKHKKTIFNSNFIICLNFCKGAKCSEIILRGGLHYRSRFSNVLISYLISNLLSEVSFHVNLQYFIKFFKKNKCLLFQFNVSQFHNVSRHVSMLMNSLSTVRKSIDPIFVLVCSKFEEFSDSFQS